MENSVTHEDHGCEHCAGTAGRAGSAHESNSTRKRLLRIIIGGVLLAVGIVLHADIIAPITAIPYLIVLELVIFLAAYIITGGDILLKAARNILRGRVFDENLLMSIATIGAFAIGEYPEGVAVMLFFQTGELFQHYAVDKSRKSIAALMDIRPDYANLKRGDSIERVSPDEVYVGDIIVIKPGERIPLDAVVIDGASAIDTSALTGESIPREVYSGDDLLSGCINLSGMLTAKVSKVFKESTVSKILDLVENSASKKAKTENFITKFARYYTPVVVALALLISVVPPLIFSGETFGDWVYRGLTFLVISCPCALVISIPLGFFGGIGGASRNGILVKGSNYLEALARTETVVFDKTGTLTKGVFEVSDIKPQGMSGDALLELAAYAESFSNHPISSSLGRAYGREIDNSRIGSATEIAGHGVCTIVDGKNVLAGNARLMEKENIPCFEGETLGSTVHVAVDGIYAGYIIIADEIKDDSRMAITALAQAGVSKTVMLTGDSKYIAKKVASDLGLDEVYAELLPADKVGRLEELLAQKCAKGTLAYVGDGINDAPVLARADVGIAMGGLGSDAAVEAADVVIMTDQPSKVAAAIQISKRTLGIVTQNIVFSIAVKFGVLLLAALGIVSMWGGVAADVGVTLLAVLNAMRGLRVNR